MATSHLVVLFVVTGGQNAENLGSDEEQVVLFVYLLYDVANNKVLSLHQHYVRPTKTDISTDIILTEECKAQTGLNEEYIRNAQPLEHVLDEFDRFLSAKEIHPDHGGRPFCLMTDGPLHLRLCVHPETCNKNIPLPSYFNRYYDIRKEFRKFYKPTGPINCIKDMFEFLGLECEPSIEYGVSHCQQMSNIIQRLVSDGHEFTEPEIIKDKLEPGICAKSDYVDDESVIRARGLPWQSSDQDIARFFKGLNIAKGGVALCLSQQGRRNGEALIRFEGKEHKDLALRKHKHHLGQRYIEVYKASGKDFVNVAGGNSSEAQTFLSRHSNNGGQVIVRMRGLPYSASQEQVLEFFRSGDSPTEVLDGEDGILFVHQADGRATGDAFVLFASDEDANKALTKHRECIGARYIELFKSTTAEVQQVLNRSLDPRNPTEPEAQLPPLIPQVPTSQILMNLPQQLITSGTQRDCIRLRGLPFEATVTDILTFLAEYARNIVFQGVHMVYSAQGTPSGEAFIQMDSEQSAELTTVNRHKKFMFINNKKRYIEVLQCSGEDMNLVLTNGIMPPSAASLVHPAVAATAQVVQRPVLSPGGTNPMMQALYPGAAMASATGLYPFGAVPGMPSPAVTANPAALAVSMGQHPIMAAAQLPPGIQTMAQMTHIPQSIPRPGGAAYAYQPVLYWYPSPPVSPQTGPAQLHQAQLHQAT